MRPALAALAFLTAASGFLFVGYLFSIMAMRIGDVALVSPFRYTLMIWAIVMGILVFGEYPDEWTLIGAAIGIGSVLLGRI